MEKHENLLAGKKVVITGASRGIGRALADSFAARGCRLFLCSRNEVNLYNAVAALQTRYPDTSIKARAANLSDKSAAIEFGQWVNQEGGATDILINNAGTFQPGSVYNEPDGHLEEMMAINLYSAYHLTRVLLPPMMTAKSGQIFNICSIAALQAYANGGGYSISKFAMLGFSKNLREELKPYHIKVCAVSPGAVHTDTWGDFDNSNRRIMEAADVAATILAAAQLSPAAVVEDIVLRPQLGDL